MTRRIGVVTVGRSDYGIYYPLLRAIRDDVQCQLSLIAGGAHLSPAFGNTLSEIEGDGFEIGARVPMLLSGDSPEEIAMSMGVGVINFTNAYRDIQPNLLVLLGDRFEMLAAAIAALPLRIPVAHLHGGGAYTRCDGRFNPPCDLEVESPAFCSSGCLWSQDRADGRRAQANICDGLSRC